MTRHGGLDLRLPSLPPRSRLYHLAPIGVGTSDVESLTGYLERLAETHTVQTSSLVSRELLPVLRPGGLAGIPTTTWLSQEGPRLNGTGAAAREAAHALGVLTGRQDLLFLTLHSWTPVVAAYGLLRIRKHARRWCDACYQDDLEQGTPVYERLLWSMAAVTICPRHRTRLSDRCPYDDCAHVLPGIAAASRPGHCSRCRRFLCRSTDRHELRSVSQDDPSWEIWVAGTVGDLLAATPAVTPALTHAHFLATLETLIAASDAGEHGTHGQFARDASIHDSLIYRLRKGGALPSLRLLLRLSHYLGVPLVNLLTGAARSVQREDRFSAVIAPAARPHAPPMALDSARLQQAVTAILASDERPPPSVAELTRRLGCTSGALFKLFPAECLMISSRFKTFRRQERDKHRQELIADVRQAMTQLDARGIYPASKRIWPLMRQRVHPRRSDYNTARRQILHELGWTTGGTRFAATSLAPRSMLAD